MALVSGVRSTLNPNAPLFVPAAVRQVEDFSPEWWQLATTSTWFHDYWLSQQQGDDGFFGNSYDDSSDGNGSDIVDLLPDSIDGDEDFASMEAQYEQFLLLSEMETRNTFSPSVVKQMPTNGADAVIRSLSMSKSMKERGPKFHEKPAKSVSPKARFQRIQQPR